MDDAKYFKCGKCGYEFLSKTGNPTCPKCNSQTIEEKDVKRLLGFDE